MKRKQIEKKERVKNASRVRRNLKNIRKRERKIRINECVIQTRKELKDDDGRKRRDDKKA